MTRGIWVSETEFRAFAAPETGLASHIATRMRAGDVGAFFGLLPNPDPVLRRMGKSIEVYRDLTVDPLVKGGRRRRRAAVVGMERSFEQAKAGARVVKSLESLFTDLAVPLEQLIRGLCDGAMYGYAVAEIMWGRVGGLVVPVDLVVKPPEWFGFDSEAGGLRFRPRGSLEGEPVPEHKFIVVGNQRSYWNPYGEPDLASCFWPVTFKRGGLRFWTTFTEKYGMPWAVGKLPRAAGQKEVDELADKLDRMVRDAVAVVPDDASVDVQPTGSAANADMYEKLLMYCRSEINIALLGNNQTVELQSNRASATAGAGVEDELADDDAAMVADGLNQLVGAIVALNWPSSAAPQYQLVRPGGTNAEQAKRDRDLRDIGVRFTREYFQRSYDLQAEDIESIDVADNAAAAAPAAAPAARGARAAATAKPDAAGGVNEADDELELAEGDELPADQAVIDAAIEQLPADEIQAAMQAMLRPAIEAVQAAATPDEAIAALAEAYPRMDAGGLQELLTRTLFVCDLVGRDAVRGEDQAADADRGADRLARLAARRQGRA